MNIFLFLVGLVAIAFAEVIQLSPDQEKEVRLALENPDLYEGDMAGIDGLFDAERNAIVGDRYRWPNAQVPYVIDASLSSKKELILSGMNEYHNKTCVRFVPRTTEPNYIRIFMGEGCWSHVGKINGRQDLSFGSNCYYRGIVIHELGHALGFWHEHSRSDRDEYLYIYLENVAPSERHNFKKLAAHENILYNSFDYDSIMIYDNKAFSTNGGYTMVAKNRQELTHPAFKPGLSKNDIERISKMYNC